MQFKTFVALSIVFLVCTSAGAKGEAQLTQVLAPGANWLNPVDGTLIEFTLTAEIETESSQSIMLLVGLPFTPTTNPTAYVRVADDSCDLEDESWMTGSVSTADTSELRTMQDGLTYYWVSSSAMYEPDSYIDVAIGVTLNGDSGFNDPLDVALTTSTSQYYMILAQNTNVNPIYQLDTPDTLTITDATDSAETDDSVLGSTFTGYLDVATGAQARRFMVSISGYSFNSNAPSDLVVVYTDDDDNEMEYDTATELDVELDDGALVIRLVNETAGVFFEAGTYNLALRIDVPDSPTSASFEIYTMDKYGPQIIEEGTLASVFTSNNVGWQSNYPKVTFSLGFDASSSDVKESYGLYTSSGTSMVYNHLVFAVKQSTYDIPDGDQTLEIVIGSSSNGATCAEGTIETSLTAASGSSVSCSCSSTTLTCSGINLSKSVEGKVAIKIAYSSTSSISDFGESTLKVDGTTIVNGSPSLKDNFNSPIANTSPLSPSDWSQHITSSVASATPDSSLSLTKSNFLATAELSATYNGLRQGDGQYLYMKSRIGPYSYYTASEVSISANPENMFFEITVSKDIDATYADTDVSNGIFYIEQADMLARDLDSDFYWDSANDEGWLYYAVERPICDADLDGASDDSNTYATCVTWYCYEDVDMDGSYDSPQPCKPIRACDDNSLEVSLWYPEVKMPYHTFDTSDDKEAFADSDFMQFDDIIISDWTLPLVPGKNSLNKECRPVRECDSTDASANNAVYYTTSSYGDDCLRSSTPLCNLATTASTGVLDLYDSDDSGTDSGDTCTQVEPCDIDFQDEGSTESRVDGGYCNSFKTADYRTCDLPGSLGFMKVRGDGHRASGSNSDCISMPLCTQTNAGGNPYDYTLWLSDLAESDSYCIGVESTDVCTDFLMEDYDGSGGGVADLIDYPGLGLDSSGNSDCVFLSACNMAPTDAADEEWLTSDHVDGKACSRDLPYCNIFNHMWNVNAPLFVGFSDSNLVITKNKGLKQMVYDRHATYRGNNAQVGTWTCVELDACDTFDSGKNRMREDSKACYKAVDPDDLSVVPGAAPSLGTDNWWLSTANYINNASRYQLIANDLSGAITRSANGVTAGFCNAKDDDGNDVYLNLWGQETDCSSNPSMDICDETLQRRTSWGIVQSVSTGTYYGKVSKSACVWQIPCTVRTTKMGDVDAMNGWDCITIDSDSLCTSDLSESAAYSRTNAAYTLYESIGDASDCIITPSCYLNAWIQNSKYYMHAKGFGDQHSMRNPYLRKSFPNWSQYTLASDAFVFVTEGCQITSDGGNDVSYLDPDGLNAETALQYAISASWLAETRRLADYDYGNDDDLAINVPADFLFVEDIDLDNSFSTTNPIEAVAFDDSGDVYNVFKFQLATVEAGYVAAPKDDDDTTSTFTVQTWNLVFFDPLQDNDQTTHNFFAFTDVNIATTAVNQLSADYTDYYVQDLFWAVYFDASTDDISVSLTESADISGLENLVIYTNMDNSDDTLYFGAGGLKWTTFSYYTNSDLAGNFLNIFMLYGTSLGSETSLSTASELVIFFDSAEGVDEDLDCTSKGISISGCTYTEAIGDTSASVAYYTTDRSTTSDSTVYNSLYRSRIGISIDSVDDDTFSIIFPFVAGDRSSRYLTMGMLDGADQLQYLSARGNGNNFQFGQGSRTFYTTSSDDTLASISTNDDVVQEIYDGDDSNAPTSYAWIEIPDNSMVGDTVTTTINAVLDYDADDQNGGFSGVMFCSSYDFTGDGFEIAVDSQTNTEATNSPNYYGCWDPLEYDDMICVLCNTDGESGDFTTPYTISVTDFVIPSEAGLTFPSDTVTVVFNSDGEADSILYLYNAADLWSTAVIEITAGTTSINRAHSQKIALTFTTDYGIPSGSTITLALDTSIGANEISVEKDVTTPASICYIEDTSSTNACTFSLGNDFDISVGSDIAAGSFTVNMYGLYALPVADSAVATGTDNYGQFTVEVTNSAGADLYMSEDDEYVTINYGTASYEVTVSDIMLKKDNDGWNTVLMFYVETDKPVYEEDYFFISIDGFANSDETPECNVFNDDWEVSQYFTTCDLVSLADITLTPSVDSNSMLSNLGFYVTLNNIYVSGELDDSTITASLMYNEGVTAITSEEEDLPEIDTTASDISDLAVSISMDYVGVASTVTLTFTSPIDVTTDDEIYIAFSTNYGYTLGEGMFYVTVNEESVSVERAFWNAIETQGVPTAIAAGDTVTIEIAGIDSPNIASGEERTFMVGIEDTDYSDDNTLVAVGSVSITTDVTDLSAVDLFYPRFQTLSTSEARMDADLTFDVEAADSYAVGSVVYAKLMAAGYAVTQAGSVSCSVEGTSDGAEYAENCQISNNVVSFSLKSALTAGDTYTVELKGLPNPDWETCEANIVTIEVYSEGTLMASTAPGLDDSMGIDIETPDYSIEVEDVEGRLDDLEFAIGFYTEITLSSSLSVFYDDIEFSIVDQSGFVSLDENANINAYIGYEEATITIGVSASAYETMSTLVISADTDDIARAPVIPYELEEEVEDLEVNSGTEVTVETGSTTAPISICIEDMPVESQDFDITIEATDTAEDPMLTIDTSSITLSSSSTCAFVIIDATDEEATVDRTATLTITPTGTIFDTYTTSVTVVEATSTDTVLTASYADPEEYTVTFTVEANQAATVGVYLAPTVDYLLGDSFTEEDFEALLDGTCVLSTDSSATLEVYVDTAIEIVFEDLLRNTDYSYAAIAIGAGSSVDVDSGELTTAAGDIPDEAATYDVTIVGELTDEEEEDLICNLAEIYGVPSEDITTADGVSCDDDEDDDDANFCSTSTDDGSSSSSSSEYSDSSSSTTSSSAGARMLQTSSSDSTSGSSSSSSSDDTVYTEFTYRILPPTRSWVPDYVSEPEDAATTLERIQDIGDYEFDSVSEPYTVSIEEVSSVSSASTSVTETTFTVSGLYPLDASDNQVAGSVCYAIFLGTVEATVSQIVDGATDDQDALVSDCEYIDTESSLTVEYTEASADTDYTISYYAQSIDTREYSTTTDAINTSVRTEAVVEEEEEEESGYLTSIAFLTLLVALFFNF